MAIPCFTADRAISRPSSQHPIEARAERVRPDRLVPQLTDCQLACLTYPIFPPAGIYCAACVLAVAIQTANPPRVMMA